MRIRSADVAFETLGGLPPAASRTPSDMDRDPSARQRRMSEFSCRARRMHTKQMFAERGRAGVDLATCVEVLERGRFPSRSAELFTRPPRGRKAHSWFKLRFLSRRRSSGLVSLVFLVFSISTYFS